jgi:small subunit ribosomal protein S6
MRKYETIFIINPDLSEEDSKGVIDKVRGIIQSLQGEVLRIEEWGKKKLAYEIKKMSKGLFILLHFLGTAELLSELERNLRLMDAVLKYQTVRLDEKGEKAAQMLLGEKPSETEEQPESQATSDGETGPPDEGTQEKAAPEPLPKVPKTTEEPDGSTEEEAHS